MTDGGKIPASAPESARAPHLQVGVDGELVAATFLRETGYRVFAKNTRLNRDEIDLIAHDPTDDVIVFVEVKTRRRQESGYHPSIGATAQKRAKLRRSARAWVARHDYRGGYRIDLVSVAGGRVIEHVKELSWGNENR